MSTDYSRERELMFDALQVMGTNITEEFLRLSEEGSVSLSPSKDNSGYIYTDSEGNKCTMWGGFNGNRLKKEVISEDGTRTVYSSDKRYCAVSVYHTDGVVTNLQLDKRTGETAYTRFESEEKEDALKQEQVSLKEEKKESKKQRKAKKAALKEYLKAEEKRREEALRQAQKESKDMFKKLLEKENADVKAVMRAQAGQKALNGLNNDEVMNVVTDSNSAEQRVADELATAKEQLRQKEAVTPLHQRSVMADNPTFTDEERRRAAEVHEILLRQMPEKER